MKFWTRIMCNYRQKLRVMVMLAVFVAITILLSGFLNTTNSFHMKETAESEPLQQTFYLHTGPVSKDLVVYSAYFDGRPRKNHTNITMIFIEANRIIFNSQQIIGCGVGSTVAASFIVRYVQEDILMHSTHGISRYPYTQLVVECYDLKVINGSRAFVMYNTRRTGEDFRPTIVIESERPVIIPAPRIKPSGKHNFSVVVCTKAHTRGVSWLPEFLRYQKTLGVDHVHLTVLDEFIKDGGYRDLLLTDPSFIKAVNENFISVQVWKEWYNNKESYEHATILMYLDCIYRYRGTYDYVSLMDSDDFFTVRDPNKKYKDIIQEYCFKKPAGSCSFKWLFFYPGLCGVKGEVGEDGNVTAQLVSHQVDTHFRLKSIHSTAAIVDSSFHDATCDGCLLPGYSVVPVPPHIAYVAHNRMHMDGILGAVKSIFCYL